MMLTFPIQAQLLNEIGMSFGGANYSGDVGDEQYVMPNKLAGGLIYRRNLNSRISLRGTYTFYVLSDDDKLSSNIVKQQRGYSFTNNLNELALGIEFNFLEYDITHPNKDYSPYLFFELAGFNYKTVSSQNTDGTHNFQSDFALAIPLGVGFKAGITREIGVGIEFRARYALTDELDYTSTEINSLDLDLSKRIDNDWYFFTGILLTYSFQRPPCAVKPRY